MAAPPPARTLVTMVTTAVPIPRGADRHANGALGMPNFRLHLADQVLSQTGTWLQLVAAVPAAALGVLVLTDSITVPLLYVTALACGVVYAVENPVRNAFVAELVEHRLIPAAVSLTSAIGAAGRVLGPLGAGVLLATTDLGWCFLMNAASYLVALAGLLFMRREKLHLPPGGGAESTSVAAGLRYAWRVPELRTALTLTAVVATFGFNHQVLVPLLAHRTFAGDAGTYTLLYSAMSVGSVLGAVVAAPAGSSTSGSSAAPRSASASSPDSSRSHRRCRSPSSPGRPAAVPDCCSSPRPPLCSSNAATPPCGAA
ncbi:MAG: MFS transporter [Pseudonocardiaceae bacterium]